LNLRKRRAHLCIWLALLDVLDRRKLCAAGTEIFYPRPLAKRRAVVEVSIAIGWRNSRDVRRKVESGLYVDGR
jgi:hypothetical protein